MAISASINKDGKVTLWTNPEFNISKDLINFREVVLNATDTEVTCYGILTADCVGVSCSKDKAWKPEGQRVIYRVFKDEKQAWDKEVSKFVTTKVHKDENLLYRVLCDKVNTYPIGTVFLGNIIPWVNPYLWEIDHKDLDNLSLIERLTKPLESLIPAAEPYELTQSEIASAFEANTFNKKTGTYVKPEIESERLEARFKFLKAQLEDVFQFTTLYDLAGQIEATKTDDSQICDPTIVIYNSVQTTLDLLRIILGGK